MYRRERERKKPEKNQRSILKLSHTTKQKQWNGIAQTQDKTNEKKKEQTNNNQI